LVNLFFGRLALKLFTQALAHILALRARGIFERSIRCALRLRRFFRNGREQTGDRAAIEATRRAVVGRDIFLRAATCYKQSGFYE
jgi:hypothetical protein